MGNLTKKCYEDNIKLTQNNFNIFCEALNHRMTRIESDVKWMKRIGYYMAGVISAIAIKLLFI